MSNSSYTLRENALAAYNKDDRVLNSKSSERSQRTEERSQTMHSIRSSMASSHGNMYHEYDRTRPPFGQRLGSGTQFQQGNAHTKQRRAEDPYLAALTKETRGKTKNRYSSTDYLMQW